MSLMRFRPLYRRLSRWAVVFRPFLPEKHARIHLFFNASLDQSVSNPGSPGSQFTFGKLLTSAHVRV